MNLNIYSIYDTATAAYMRPFYMQSDAAAVRSFSDLAVSADHEIANHPGDYSLVRIGVWNDSNGQTTPEDPSTLITGLEAVAASRQVVKPNGDATE
jgi:hypothetical protein